MQMEHMFGGGAAIWMLLWWLIGLGVLFFVIYEAVYLAISRALRENGIAGARQRPGVPEQSQPPSTEG